MEEQNARNGKEGLGRGEGIISYDDHNLAKESQVDRLSELLTEGLWFVGSKSSYK